MGRPKGSLNKKPGPKATKEQQAWSSGVELAPKLMREVREAQKLNAAYARCFERPLVHQDFRSGTMYTYRIRELWRAEGMVTRSEVS